MTVYFGGFGFATGSAKSTAQGRVQAGAQMQEAGLQQGHDAGWRATERGDEGRRAQGRARDDIELRLMRDFCDAEE